MKGNSRLNRSAQMSTRLITIELKIKRNVGRCRVGSEQASVGHRVQNAGEGAIRPGIEEDEPSFERLAQIEEKVPYGFKRAISSQIGRVRVGARANRGKRNRPALMFDCQLETAT